ncbi:hypothetical protein [Phreatobacter stygius]|uniref:Uncharacterized protein n=1 Tax=Phreatobacter stygius TaxID=1940610 RepID=A0A4D7B4J2_9HYPH|nr:hypothetical protein [Phreatobacter stygius]QCI67851.1 hypothetical protein E8M01_28670 [Phreatobacter stygius]
MKLRLTSLALGCSTSKELCARFAAVNPETAFTVQNAYKWVRGKATPRLSSVYDDWARILGGGLAASFVAASSFDEFAQTIRGHLPVPDAALAKLRLDHPTPPPLTPPVGEASARTVVRQPSWRPNHWLAGCYLVISLSWSQAEMGNLILGRAEITPADGDDFAVRYTESLFGQDITMSGPMLCDGRTAQAALRCSLSLRTYFLALRAPSPPANVVGGILSGAALHDFEARSMAGRVVLIRDHLDRRDPPLRQGYLAASPALLDEQIGHLGYVDPPGRMAATTQLLALIQATPVQGLLEMPPDALGALGLDFDRIAPGGTRASP